jgi:AcrR family transcriptional regulator
VTQPQRRARRSDAQDNRARIIETARAVLTDAPNATLQSIAKRAAVGQGTMYRHFPSREALLLAVYWQDIEALIDAAPRLLDEYQPLEALRLWLDRLAAYAHSEHATSQAVAAATRVGLGSHCCAPVVSAVEELLVAGKEARQLRPDVDAAEILLLVSFLWEVVGGPNEQERSRHVLAIVIDGLRVGARG